MQLVCIHSVHQRTLTLCMRRPEHRTLVGSKLFDIMCIPEQQSVQYNLSTCAGRSNVVDRQMCGTVVESFDNSFKMEFYIEIELRAYK